MRYGFLFAYTYLCVNVFCALVSVGFARNITRDMGTHAEVRCMRLVLLTFVGYLGVDFLWELGESGLVPLLAGMQAALNVVSCILICLIACWWALYAEMRLHRHLASMRGFQIAFLFPFAIMSLLLVSSLVNNLSLATGERLGSTWGDLYTIRLIVVVSYLALAAGHAALAVPRAATDAKRVESLLIILFAVALTLFAVLDAAFPYLPFMSVGLMWTVIMVFVRLQHTRIYSDALTSLANRRRMDEYLHGLLTRRRTTARLLYIFDINSFKQINDTYGHLEGDRALKVVALALRQTAKEYGGFAARWGGDEFVLVVPVTPSLERDPEVLPAFANDAISRLVAQESLQFDVTLSAGHTLLEEADSAPSDPIGRADAMLYESKRALRAG